MGFSCCKCSKNNVFASMLIDDVTNPREKPIENRIIKKDSNFDNISENSTEKNKYSTERTNDNSKNNNSIKKNKIFDSRDNYVNLIYVEEGIIDSRIRYNDNKKM